MQALEASRRRYAAQFSRKRWLRPGIVIRKDGRLARVNRLASLLGGLERLQEGGVANLGIGASHVVARRLRNRRPAPHHGVRNEVESCHVALSVLTTVV